MTVISFEAFKHHGFVVSKKAGAVKTFCAAHEPVDYFDTMGSAVNVITHMHNLSNRLRISRAVIGIYVFMQLLEEIVTAVNIANSVDDGFHFYDSTSLECIWHNIAPTSDRSKAVRFSLNDCQCTENAQPS